MTTLRGSAILARGCTGTLTRRWRLHIGSAIGLPAHPSRPDADRVRALRTRLLVKTLRVIHFGFWIGPRAGNRGRRFGGLDDGEPRAIGEVRHVDDGEHHEEGAEHRTRREYLCLGGQLL